LFASKGMGVKGIYAPGLVGACVLIAVQQVFNAIKAQVAPPKTKKE
jgi:hypothetical protein